MSSCFKTAALCLGLFITTSRSYSDRYPIDWGDPQLGERVRQKRLLIVVLKDASNRIFDGVIPGDVERGVIDSISGGEIFMNGKRLTADRIYRIKDPSRESPLFTAGAVLAGLLALAYLLL